MRSGRCNVMSICDILVSRGMLRGWLANDNSPTQTSTSFSPIRPFASQFHDSIRLASFSTELFDAIITPRSLRVYLPLLAILQKVVAEKEIDIHGLTTSHITYFCIYISSSYERISISSLDDANAYHIIPSLFASPIPRSRRTSLLSFYLFLRFSTCGLSLD